MAIIYNPPPFFPLFLFLFLSPFFNYLRTISSFHKFSKLKKKKFTIIHNDKNHLPSNKTISFSSNNNVNVHYSIFNRL